MSFPLLALLLAAGVHARAEGPEDPLQALLAGEFALQAGDIAGAARKYVSAARASDDPAVAERAARIALLAGDEAVADEALLQWRRLAPESPALMQTDAMLALQRGDREAALAALRRLLDSPGGEGWQRALQALAGQQHSVVTGTVLTDLLDADALPDHPDAWFAFGGLASRLGQEGLEARLAAAAARRFPEAPRVWLWQAQRHRLAGEPDAARAAVSRALELAGADVGVRLSAAAELDALGDSDAAAETLAAGPQDEHTLLGRVAYLARGERHEALSALYTELAEDAGEAGDERLFLLGQVAELLERNDEALRWYAQVDAPERRDEAALRQAVVLEADGKLDEALARLRELQASDSEDGESIRNAYLLEAELLLRHEREQAALATYDRGLAIFEDEPQLLYARALVLAQMERIDQAEADLSRLIAMDPDNADALNALGYTLADSTERLDEAHGYIVRALELSPESAAIIDSMGWVLYRQGEAEQALEHLRRAWTLLKDPEIAAHLGEVLWSIGEHDEARRIWAEGVELDPDNELLQETMERLGA